MLDIVKRKLRVDSNEEDEDITLLIEGAKEYLFRAGVPESNSAQYKIAIITYALLNYENHDKSLNVAALKASLETTILQLRDYSGGTT